ncbi:MAG: MmcQ/YjbR family DNA-binding protein [Pseudomonadales bacterium]
MAASKLRRMQLIREYLLSKPEAWEDYPFRLDVAVFKIRKKMFATLSEGGARGSEDCWQMNLKCDPEQALMLRDVFPAVIPGYHMNKTHWNTVLLDGSMPQGEIERMIDHSYSLVVRSLPKVERQRLELHHTAQALYGQAEGVTP